VRDDLPSDAPKLPARPMPKPTAQVAPFVEAMGHELAIAFLLRFGGSEPTLPKSPCGRSEAERLVGPEALAALARRAHLLPRRVPLANRWLAACLFAQGHSTSEIARRLRASDVSVRRWLRTAEDRAREGKAP